MAESHNVDLESMSKEQLIELRKDVEKAINTHDKRMRQSALAEARAAAEKHGFKLEDILQGGSASAKQVNPPKYRHPEDPNKTWTGRGRKPAWVSEHLDAGKSLDDLLIK